MDFVEDAYPDQGYSTLATDPVKRAQLRVAFSLVDALNGPYYLIPTKRGKLSEEDVINIREKLQKIEEFIEEHAGESNFAFGTENPTQLDIHLFPMLSRLDIFKGSAFNEAYERIRYNEFTRINKFVEAFRAREEYKPAITQRIPY